MNPAGEQLQALLAKYPKISSIELLVPDLNGILRGKRVQRAEFAALIERGLNMPRALPLLDSRGRVIEPLGQGSRDGDPDTVWHVVPGSLSPVPWGQPGMGQCLMQQAEPRQPLGAAHGRELLTAITERLHADGLYPTAAVELEFYLLHDVLGRPPRPAAGRVPGTDRLHSGPQMYSLEDLQELSPLLNDIQHACEAQSLPAMTAISEYAAGQFEINLHHVDDPLLACDQAILLRRLVRGVARQHGLAATFMAKPFTRQGGSGQHVHLSLQDDSGNNLLAQGHSAETPGQKISQAAAGLLTYLPECMPLFCPSPNSYRRLQPGQFAPVDINWGYNHRSLAVRIPLADAANTRLEHRVAGADANSYLVMAAILAAAHRGISGQLSPPEPIAPGTEIALQGQLPDHWQAGLGALEAGDLLCDYLGQHWVDELLVARRFEGQAFDAQVSDLDYDWYLRAL